MGERWANQPLRPEPTRWWLRHVPSTRSRPRRWWTDLATGTLIAPGAGREVVELEAPPDEELAYLPPGRSATANHVLLQAFAVDGGRFREAASTAAAPWLVVDATDELVRGEREWVSTIPSEASVVWPLLSGVTEAGDWVDATLAALAERGVRHVQPMSVAISPQDRRGLAEVLDERHYEQLFHGKAPSERRFSSIAYRFGLVPFADRPIGLGSERARQARKIAGVLALAGELWTRVRRSEGRGQAFFQAARQIEGEDRDWAGLIRDGNLEVVPWLDSAMRTMIEEALEDARPRELVALEREYLQGEPDAEG